MKTSQIQKWIVLIFQSYLMLSYRQNDTPCISSNVLCIFMETEILWEVWFGLSDGNPFYTHQLLASKLIFWICLSVCIRNNIGNIKNIPNEYLYRNDYATIRLRLRNYSMNSTVIKTTTKVKLWYLRSWHIGCMGRTSVAKYSVRWKVFILFTVSFETS